MKSTTPGKQLADIHRSASSVLSLLDLFFLTPTCDNAQKQIKSAANDTRSAQKASGNDKRKVIGI